MAAAWPPLWLALSVLVCEVPAITVDDFSSQMGVYPLKQKVAEHGIATFNCNTTIYPIPPMYWRRNGRRLINHGSYQIFRTWSGSVLRVEPVREKRDNTLFECVIDDGLHEPMSQSAQLMVYPKDVRPKGYPHVLEQPTLRVVEEDNFCLLACRMEGDPKPTVTWIKDYIPLDMDAYRYQILEEGSLQIGYVSSADDGTYECVVENELGVAYSHPARLIVEEYRWP